MSFAYNLKYIKDELEVTNYQLAKWFGCSQSSLINWLDGGVMPHTKTRQKIADYFGISLAELDGDERPVLPQNWKKKGSPITVNSDEAALDAELLKRLLDLTPDEVEKVDAFVQGLLAAR